MLFRVWEAVNSYMYDERMLEFLAKLAEMHVEPDISDPRKIAEIPDDEISEGEKREKWGHGDVPEDSEWGGIYRDVGIFTEHEWHLLMCKCLQSMGGTNLIQVMSAVVTEVSIEIPLADAGSLTTGPTADTELGFEIKRLPNPNWRISELHYPYMHLVFTNHHPSIFGADRSVFYGA
jgi:proteasome activator subunit 4